MVASAAPGRRNHVDRVFEGDVFALVSSAAPVRRSHVDRNFELHALFRQPAAVCRTQRGGGVALPKGPSINKLHMEYAFGLLCLHCSNHSICAAGTAFHRRRIAAKDVHTRLCRCDTFWAIWTHAHTIQRSKHYSNHDLESVHCAKRISVSA